MSGRRSRRHGRSLGLGVFSGLVFFFFTRRDAKHRNETKIVWVLLPCCTVRHGMARYGTVRYGTGTTRYGTVRYGTILYGRVLYDTVRFGMVRYGKAQYGTVRYGTVRYGTVRRVPDCVVLLCYVI